jgi:hypothetical protein
VSRLVSNARNQGPQLIEPEAEPPRAMTLDFDTDDEAGAPRS